MIDVLFRASFSLDCGDATVAMDENSMMIKAPAITFFMKTHIFMLLSYPRIVSEATLKLQCGKNKAVTAVTLRPN